MSDGSIDNNLDDAVLGNIEGGVRVRKARKDLEDYETGNIDKALLRAKSKKRKSEVTKKLEPFAIKYQKLSNIIVKSKKAKAPQLTSKEKAMHDVEEKFIVQASLKRSFSDAGTKALPDGPFDLLDESAAIARSFQEISQLLTNFSSFESKLIGSLCKVYWDGECKWFYARILNYDHHHKRHYIYYFADSTAEWINIFEEAVLVARDFVYAKVSRNEMLWPGMTYWVSAKAVTVLKQAARFYSDGVYVEFFNDTKAVEYAYVNPNNIFPLQDKYMPKKPSKRFEKSLEAAKAERESIDSVVQEVVKNVQISCFKALKGDQWIGLKVRARTHRKVASYENDLAEMNSVATSSVWCLGTVTKYCPKSTLYLVVFDEPCLQPQWVLMEKGIVDVIVQINQDSSDESLYITPIISKKMEASVSRRNRKDSSSDENPDKDIEDSFEFVGPVVNGIKIEGKVEHYNAEVGDLHASTNGTLEVISTLPDSTSNLDQCILCKQLTNTESDSNILKCYDCGNSCHKYCYDPIMSVLKPINDTSKTPFQIITVPASETHELTQHGTGDNSLKATKNEQPLIKGRNKRSKPKQSINGSDSVLVTSNQISIWRCWECVKCFHCKATVFTDDLLLWNSRRSFSGAGTEVGEQDLEDTRILLCGTCLYFYKHTQEYCIICNKLYAGIDASSIPLTSFAVTDMQDVIPLVAPPETMPVMVSLNPVTDQAEDMMIQCNECNHWIHALCEGIDAGQYTAITLGNHPIWGDEYLCPLCRVTLCNQMLELLRQLDTPGIFLYPVTESVASNYFDVIRQPMDLTTMQTKCDRGHFKSLQPLREDIELMCYNALLFNSPGDEYWNIARGFFTRVKDLFDKNIHKTKLTAYGREAEQIVVKHQALEVQLPKGNKRGNKTTFQVNPPRLSIETCTSSIANNELETSTHNVNAEKESNRDVTTDDNMKVDDNVPERENFKPEEIVNMIDAASIIEVKLGEYEDPTSYISPCLFQLPTEEAYYSFGKDFCFVCGGCSSFSNVKVDEKLQLPLHPSQSDSDLNDVGNDSEWIYCADCGEAFHTYCVQLPHALVNALKAQKNDKFSEEIVWRCLNCKLCEVCGEISEKDLDNLVFCESCDGAFHMQCLSPSVPPAVLSSDTHWYCQFCLQCESCDQSKSTSMRCWGVELDYCYTCSTSQKVGLNGRTHLGKSLDATNLIERISHIQKQRQNMKYSKIKCMKQQLNLKLKNTLFCQLPFYYLMILWAQIRQALIFKTWSNASSMLPALNANISMIQKKRKETFHEKMIYWIPCRARRYLNCYVRSRNHDPLNAKNMTLVGTSNIYFHAANESMNNFARLASLSAAFTFTTDTEGMYDNHKPLETFLLLFHFMIIVAKLKVSLKLVVDVSGSSADVAIVWQLLERLYFKLGLRIPNIPSFPIKDNITIEEVNMAKSMIFFPNEVYESLHGFLTDSMKKYVQVWDLTVFEIQHIQAFVDSMLPKSQSAIERGQIPFDSSLKENFNVSTVVHAPPIQKQSVHHWLTLSRYSLIVPSLKARFEELPASNEHASQGSAQNQTTGNYDKVQKKGAWAPGGKLFGNLLFHGSHEKSSTVRKVNKKQSKLLTSSESNFELDEVSVKHMYLTKEAIALSEVLETTKRNAEKKLEASDDAIPAEIESEAGNARGMIINLMHLMVSEVERRSSRNIHTEEVDGRTRKKPSKMVVEDGITPINTESLDKKDIILDFRSCVFCHEQSTVKNISLLGRMLPYSDGSVGHINCLVWCPEVTVTKPGHIQRAYSAADKYTKLLCYYCHRKGATIICNHLESGGRARRCKRMFHVQCALTMNVMLLQVTLPDSNLNRREAELLELKELDCSTTNGAGAFSKSSLSDTDSELESTRYWAFCPAHGLSIIDLMKLHRVPQSNVQKWIPSNSSRCLLLERNDFAVESEAIAKLMAEKRSDRAIRMGSVSILSLGNMKLDNEDEEAFSNVSISDISSVNTPAKEKKMDVFFSFSTPTAIYPIGFRMSRIYWSMIHSRKRTVYFFEILSMIDLSPDNYDAAQLNYISNMLHDEETKLPNILSLMNDSKTFSVDKSNGSSFISGNSPLFKVTALDNPSEPLFSRYLPYVHYVILQKLHQLKEQEQSSAALEKIKSANQSIGVVDRLFRKRHTIFGMNYDQFFGLALPFTRHALEISNDSWITMILPSTKYRYQPRYFLPSHDALVKTAEKRLAGRNEMIKPSIHGSSRADPIILQTSGNGGGGNGRANTKHRMTKILTKVATSEAQGEQDFSSAAQLDDFYSQIEREHTQSELNFYKQQYYTVTLGYLRNPNTKLMVKKSRIHGWGLFTKQSMSKDDIIVEYIGEKIRQAVADKREKLYEEEGFGSCYLFRLDKEEIIDATRTGGMARFINHCCEPNAYAKILSCPNYQFPGDSGNSSAKELKHITIMAARNIQEGEEITYDYKFPIEDTKLKCYCGAPRCSGSMN